MFEPRQKPTNRRWVALAVAAGLGAGAGIVLWLGRDRPQPPVPVAAAPAPAPPAPAEAPPPEVPRDRLAALLEAVSANALFRSWLALGDVVHRWAVVADNLAEGASPRKQLPFLAPQGAFSVSESRGRTVISQASYRRYDAIAEAIASVDAAAFARAERELHPLLQATWRALGYPGGSLDKVAAQALSRLELAPAPAGSVEVVEHGGRWELADPRLEALAPVEKHLLRMGPRNARLVQEKARELRTALGLSAPTKVAGGTR